MASERKFKITIARLLEMSVDQNGIVAKRIMLGNGPFQLSLDEHGQATLSGRAGRMTFNGTPALRELGLEVGVARINFSAGDEGTVRYNGTLRIGFASVSVGGDVDIDKLITSCSGFLCHAARILQGRSLQRELELERYIR